MKRQIFKSDFSITSWELLSPYFEELNQREINSQNQLEKWLLDYNELGAVVSENMAWRYINMTCDTTNTELRDRFNDFVQNIEPNISPIANDLNKKIINSPFINQLTKTGYSICLLYTFSEPTRQVR
jgi:oligoendopeptidase F